MENSGYQFNNGGSFTFPSAPSNTFPSSTGGGFDLSSLLSSGINLFGSGQGGSGGGQIGQLIQSLMGSNGVIGQPDYQQNPMYPRLNQPEPYKHMDFSKYYKGLS